MVNDPHEGYSAASVRETQDNTGIFGSCIAHKSTVGAGTNSTIMNIDRFTRMNTPKFLYATKCRTFSGQMGFYSIKFAHLEKGG